MTIGYFGPQPLFKSPWDREEDEKKKNLVLQLGGQQRAPTMFSGIPQQTLEGSNAGYGWSGGGPMDSGGGQGGTGFGGVPLGAGMANPEPGGGGGDAGFGSRGDPHAGFANVTGANSLGEIAESMEANLDPFGIGRGVTRGGAAVVGGPLGGLLGFGLRDQAAIHDRALNDRLGSLERDNPRAFDFSDIDRFGQQALDWGTAFDAIANPVGPSSVDFSGFFGPDGGYFGPDA